MSEPQFNRKHLHASVSAATFLGLFVGWWLGARMGRASGIESAIFTFAVLLGPGALMRWIDAKYLPPED